MLIARIAIASAVALTFAHADEVKVELPHPGGPYPVGRRLLDWTDDARQDPFDRSRRRELMIWVWYPAAAPGPPGEYLPREWGRSSARWEALDMRIRSGPVWAALFSSPVSAATIEHIRIHASDRARPAPPPAGRAGFPLLFFSPGLGKMPTDYTAFLEDIASYGYIVIGVNPTWFTSNTTFSDGRSVGMMPLWERGGAKLKAQFPIWVEDLKFVAKRVPVLDWLPMDASRLGTFGHSYGGAAAIEFARENPAVKAVVDWDGTPRGAAAKEALKTPAMLLQSDHGAVDHDRGSLHFFDLLPEGLRVTVRGASHRGFTDEIALPLPDKMRVELVGKVDAKTMVTLVSAHTREFFRRYFDGPEAASGLCVQVGASVMIRAKGAVCPP